MDQEAEDLSPRGSSGTLAGGTAKAVLHVTVSPSGGDWFSAMHQTLTGKPAEPHYLYDPVTDRLGQYFPLDRGARSLRPGVGAHSANKFGSRVIQVEVVAQADDPFTKHWRPGPNFRAMMRDIRANGVPDRLIARPARSYADAATLRVSYARYAAWSGWLGHCHVPGQNGDTEGPSFGHWDPGPIDTKAFFRAAHGAGRHRRPRPTYVVAQGDNLIQIAQRFGTTVAALAVAQQHPRPDEDLPRAAAVPLLTAGAWAAGARPRRSAGPEGREGRRRHDVGRPAARQQLPAGGGERVGRPGTRAQAVVEGHHEPGRRVVGHGEHRRDDGHRAQGEQRGGQADDLVVRVHRTEPGVARGEDDLTRVRRRAARGRGG